MANIHNFIYKFYKMSRGSTQLYICAMMIPVKPKESRNLAPGVVNKLYTCKYACPISDFEIVNDVCC